MISARVSAICIFALLVLRAIMAAQLPLSADEAYYWLWSQHLDAGYFDHPPMIAWLIRAGTFLFGDRAFGVRFMGIVLSLPASWFVWRAAALILKDDDRAGLAALFFNLTLMVSVELLVATPDMPSLITSAAFVYFLARVETEDDGRLWLGAGIAAGLGLLAKFSALFLGAGALLWLILDRHARKWLLSPWPYLGAGLALLIFLPNLLWQSQHQWQTFVFQFARTGAGHFTLRFLGEFLAAQLGMATPLIFLLMGAGLWRGTRLVNGSEGGGRLMLAMLVWVGLGYFIAHSLHDRVQGNWPCFLFPALGILAADGFGQTGVWRKVSVLAAPVALAFVLTVYLQAQYGFLPLKKDPLARLLGREFAPIGDVVAALVRTHLADAVLTTDYETTAWLRFNHPDIKVVQVNELQRYPQAPAADAALLRRPLIYLAEFRRDQHQLVQQLFAYTGFPTQLQTPSSLYMVYPVGRPKSSPIGKMP
ncbi:MAG TPA: glycosyltransferase family 39 protein [Rhizomicrobium sp.]|nr:glycosyltransferase family 39 protein [Rhizomicrobium sp.]